MDVAERGLGADLFGPKQQLDVARGVAELRAGRPIFVEGDATLIALPVEALDAERLLAFRDICGPIVPRLAISSHRARFLQIPADGSVELHLPKATGAAAIVSLVADAQVTNAIGATPASAAAAAGIEMTKLAQILPAVLVAEISGRQRLALESLIISVRAEAVSDFKYRSAHMVKIASECVIVLASGVNTRFVAFRDPRGDDPVAIVVGKPDRSEPVPVRIHSACLTGDVFGSRRCDCGDQLKLALKRLDEAGGGVILYLPQEGRGLGFANKMRVYSLQDTGLDTVDANTTLGFDDDERDYSVAATMLRMLGWSRAVLLTNNPTKLEGLSDAGIEITGRIPLETQIHSGNRRYLRTKAARAGHHLSHVISSLDAAEDFDEDRGLRTLNISKT